jgi:predicted N-acyltransferase
MIKNQPTNRGLGDTIAKITHFFRIDVLAQKIAKLRGKEDCGCERRREKLNNLVPYKKQEE